MIKLITASLLSLLAFSVGSASAQDFSKSENLYKKTCRACHGSKAKGTNTFPKLAGLSAEFIAERLKQYRAGEDVGTNSGLMKPVAEKLSDEQIDDISNYIATTFP